MKFKSEVQLEALNNATVDTDKFLVSDSTTVKYRTGAQVLSDLGVSGIYVPYTGATGNVDLGTHTLLAKDLIINHSSGSGVAASITKNGSGEALTVIKGSGSGNAMSVTGGLTSLVNLSLSTVANATGDFLTHSGSTIHKRTPSQVLSDIGGQAALTNPITGTGTTNYVSKFTGSTSLGNSQIFDNGTNVGIGINNTFGWKTHIYSPSSADNLLLSSSTSAVYLALADNNSTVAPRIGGITNDIFVTTNNTERIRFTSGGNIGIGTTNPNRLLTVSGTTSGLIALNASSYRNTTIGSDSVGNFVVYDDTEGAYRMVINSSGNVGIGTTSPSSKLTVDAGDVTLTNGNLYVAIGSGNNYSSRLSTALNYPNVDTYLDSIGGGGWEGRLNFRTSSNGGSLTTKMTITDSGSVGIGTSSPISKLTVVGSISAINSGVDGSFADAFVGAYSTNNNEKNAIQTAVSSAASLSGIRFQASNGGGSAGRTTVVDFLRDRQLFYGSVGIGTTSPSVNLQVTNTSGELFRLTNTTGTERLHFYTRNSASNSRIGSQNSSLQLFSEDVGFDLILGTSNTERMRIASNGAIKFNAYGSGSFTGTATQKLAVDSSGNVIEIPIGGGAVDGSGTTNYVTKWTDADTIGNSQIFDNGNVGIGTSSPAKKLDVDASASDIAYFRSNYSGNAQQLLLSSAGSGITLQSQGYLSTSSSALSLQPFGGNVGIGTTSPNSTLQVSKAGVTFQVTDTNKTANNTFSVYGLTQTSWAIATGNSGSFSGGEKIVLLDNGNVGIGNTSPSAKLDVNGTGRFIDQVKVFDSGYPTTYATSLRTATGAIGVLQLGNNNDNYILAGNQGPNGFLIFRVNCSSESITSGIEAMRITSAGNVGIGTTSPTYKLQVVNSGNTLLQLNGNNTAGTIDTGFTISADDSKNIYLYQRENASTVFGTNNTERMRITSSGNVGIGTTSPTQKLDVAGTIRAFGAGNAGRITSVDTQAGGASIAFNPQFSTGIPGIETIGAFPMVFYTNSSEKMRISSSGNVGIGTASPNASAILHLRSTTQGFLPPVMRTGERNDISSPAVGLMIFNEEEDAVQVFTSGEGWRTLAWA